MREILFRGKDVGGNWHYGVPLVFTEDYICMTAPYTYNKAIIPDTVGQYTGMHDNNGTRIFEGDIVECAGEDELLKVEWCEDTARFKLSASTFCCDFDNYWGYEIEVIGNIHDNPELL